MTGNRNVATVFRKLNQSNAALVLLTVLFMAGCFVGVLLAQVGDGEIVSEFLAGYLVNAADGLVGYSFFSILWNTLKWPLLIAVLEFTQVGFIAVPILIFLRGILFSYLAANLDMVFGLQGVALSIGVYLITILMEIPVLFLLGSHFMNGTEEGQKRSGTLLVSAGVCVLAAALQWTVSHRLLAFICGRVF